MILGTGNIDATVPVSMTGETVLAYVAFSCSKVASLPMALTKRTPVR